MATPEALQARVGTVIASRYRLMRLLGSGGMGAVYEAENLRTGRRVAIKVLIAEGRGTVVYVRFLREARAAARIVHPNVVQVLDADEDSATEGGVPYIVQEYLEGQDLRRLLQSRGRLSVEETCAIMVPVMEGLAVAHAKGIVHRDIKPENIFLSKGPSDAIVPKVIDFGIAKLTEGEANDEAPVTHTGAMLGTPAYMSPEQVRGQRDLDAQTDVWALGVVLYEMLGGRDPFGRPAPNATIAAILLDPVEPLDSIAPGVPAAVAEVVHRALDRNRVRRWQDVEAMRDALVASASHADGTVPPTSERTSWPPTRERDRDEVLALDKTDRPSTLAGQVRASRRRAATWALVLGAAALLGTAGLTALRAPPGRAVQHAATVVARPTPRDAVADAAADDAATVAVERPVVPAPVPVPTVRPSLAVRRPALHPFVTTPTPTAAPVTGPVVNGAPVIGLE